MSPALLSFGGQSLEHLVSEHHAIRVPERCLPQPGPVDTHSPALQLGAGWMVTVLG